VRLYVAATASIAALLLGASAGGRQPAHGKPAPKSITAEAQASRADVLRFRARVEEILGQEGTSRDYWGISVADADTGETLYTLNADHFFAPASNAKVVTTAMALATLGPDYRFRTTLESANPPSSDGRLTGDLILVGRGDPDLSNRQFPYAGKDAREGAVERALVEMADAAVAKGLREVGGDIVADDSYFPYDPYPAGWTTGDLFFTFGAPVTALTLNENIMYVEARPGAREGDPASISVQPSGATGTFDYETATIAPGEKSEFAVVRQPGPTFMRLRATIAAGHAPMAIELAMPDPALTAARTLKQLLEARGVRVTGETRIQHSPPPQTTAAGEPVLPGAAEPASSAARFVLAEHLSPVLLESVRVANKLSQNLHAELFLRTVGREELGLGSTAAGLKIEKSFLARAGVAPGDILLSDGSGLSRDNLVTPRGIVALLRYASRQPWGHDFASTLPVAGVDGTLEERMKKTAGSIEAKTGSIEHVHALSGYATTLRGEHLAFAIFSNNGGQHGYDSAPIDAVASAMVEMLASPKSAAAPEPGKVR
jgi:serine-type D-Ala-D-Ala carboxypeptidase/endopeptidase (penicillin-binding protein 4)